MMKISKSKRQLAQLLIEAGVTQFPDGAYWVAQDKSHGRRNKNIGFYRCLPVKPDSGGTSWSTSKHDHNGIVGAWIEPDVLIPNWHQTVLSRDEFDRIIAETAPDADGWIEWRGGECPVGDVDRIDVKFSDGGTLFGVDNGWDWGNSAGCCNIIAYRLHKHEKSLGELCGEAKEENKHEHIDVKPTIEQLAADYRNAKDYAERKQQEADYARYDADAKLKALELAGEALGLLVSPITAKQEPELATVQVGDEVECVESNIKRDKYNGMVGRLRTIDESGTSTPYLVDFGGEGKIWCHKVKFIRRP